MGKIRKRKDKGFWRGKEKGNSVRKKIEIKGKKQLEIKI